MKIGSQYFEIENMYKALEKHAVNNSQFNRNIAEKVESTILAHVWDLEGEFLMLPSSWVLRIFTFKILKFIHSLGHIVITSSNLRTSTSPN